MSTLLATLSTPVTHPQTQMEAIVKEFGIVVIPRHGSDLAEIIAANPMLTANRSRIYTSEENILDRISSTAIRRAVRECRSLRYLTPPAVEEYIQSHHLWKTQ